MLCANVERRQIEAVEKQKEMLDLGGVEDHLDDVPPPHTRKSNTAGQHLLHVSRLL